MNTDVIRLVPMWWGMRHLKAIAPEQLKITER